MNTRICGLDEAGRGALAGPLVAAGVILKIPGQEISSRSGVPLRDSKTLSKKQRDALYATILDSGSTVLTMQISSQQINLKGIGWANKEIFRLLIQQLTASEYIVDGNLKIGPIPGVTGIIRSVIDADATQEAVICAGIVAKVTRDSIMQQLHEHNPIFGWDHNAGYGTKLHVQSLRTHGKTNEHRTLFVTTALNKK